MILKQNKMSMIIFWGIKQLLFYCKSSGDTQITFKRNNHNNILNRILNSCEAFLFLVITNMLYLHSWNPPS